MAITTVPVCRLAALAAALAPITVLAQNTTYNFAGATMTATAEVNGGVGTAPTALDGSIVLPAPLGDDLSEVAVTASYAQFTFDGSNAGGPQISAPQYAAAATLTNPYPVVLTVDTLDFSTNSSGQITGWDLALSAVPLSFETWTATSTPTGETASYTINVPNSGDEYLSTSYADAGGSSWALASPEIDPEGAVTGLTLLIGGVLLLRGRRKATGTLQKTAR